MPFRVVKVTPDLFYHVYNRGNNKEPIFFEPANYRFFLKRFVEYFPGNEAEIHAYCLLPNHYHILFRLRRNIDYSIRMQHFSISYAKSLNNWSARVGHVFQGRFKAKLVGSTEYLLHLRRYIHLNPVLARLVRTPEDWQFSSYRDYLEGQDSRNLREASGEISGIYTRPSVTTEFILSHFACVDDYRSFLESHAINRMIEMEEELWKEREFLGSLSDKGVRFRKSAQAKKKAFQ
ncbi:MAG: transposase [Ignavibacteriales bacterium]|nr:transposase [Ignavibacteriales bacterium]